MASASGRHLDRRDAGRRREIIAPEGVPLGFCLARPADRVIAFLLDMVIITAALSVLGLLVGAGASEPGLLRASLVVLAFVLQNAYFIYFEVAWQGVTPGKRVMGLRVIDGHGGVLSADAVIARNLMRDIEVFIPIQIALAPDQIGPGAPAWAIFLASLWMVVFALMPLLNRDRLRIGDLVAGTLVVVGPRALLLPDVGDPGGAPAARSSYRFTGEQLGVYGIYELQVLEDLLRGDAGDPEHAQALATVCEQIKRKIGWDQERWNVDPERFLRAFYAALRAHLERNMLFGKRREDKHSPM